MFAAVIVRGSRKDPRDYGTGDDLLAALTPYDQADVTGVWQDDRALVAHALTWNTSESRHEQTPEICPDTGRVIAAWARLDNRQDLCIALGLEPCETLTDPQIILAAHRAWGADCAVKLEGDFSFVIYDPAHHHVFCARDTFGARSLFYYLTNEVFIASTTFAVFTQNTAFNFFPTVRWAASRLQYFHGDTLATPFDEVTKLAPSHHLSMGQTGIARPVRYFSFNTGSPCVSQLDSKWVDAYREKFFEAVDQRLRSAYLIAAESSGGLDSSGIVARAADMAWHGREQLHCFGFVEMSEEHAWVLRTAYHCRIPNSHILVRPSLDHPEETVQRAIKAIGYPPENDIPLATAPFFAGCQLHGARTLLSGFGGDEFVTNKAGDTLREFLKNRQFGAFIRQFDLKNAHNQAVAAAKHVIGRKENPIGGWMRALDIYQGALLRDELKSSAQKNPFAEVNRAMREAPNIGARQLLHPIYSFGMAVRLEECSLVAQSYGVDMRWPLLDRNLVAQYLRTPSIEKRCKSMGRFLHRRAIAGTVPDSIVWKRTKSLGGAAQWSLDTTNPCPTAWEDLPAIFQEVVDPQKLDSAQAAVANGYTKRDEAIHRLRRRGLQVLELASNWVHSLSD